MPNMEESQSAVQLGSIDDLKIEKNRLKIEQCSILPNTS